MAYAISVFTEWSDRYLFVDDEGFNTDKITTWFNSICQGNPDLVYLENVESTDDESIEFKVQALFDLLCYGEGE